MLYDPALHATHADVVPGEYVPPTHVVQLVTLPRLYEPAAHALHEDVVVLAYMPAAHDEHTEAFAALKPVVHAVHAVTFAVL